MTDQKLNVLIIGGGGREHALAWKVAASPRLKKLYVAPGNGGTSQIAENVAIDVTDNPALVQFAQDHAVDFTIVGLDDALANGIVDAFQSAGLAIFGPTQAAAQIEASKAYAKELMQASNVPTASFKTFSVLSEAIAYVQNQEFPLFIKASGLARGKGAVRCDTVADAEKVLQQMMEEKIFGEAGETVVIESFLDGPELSLHAFCDGTTYRMLPSSQDNKAIFDGGKGPNTGGIGTIAPLPIVEQASVQDIAVRVVAPILHEMDQRGSPFKGLLYPGIKLTSQGPKIVEYNARFGDPETQVYMRLLESDLLDVLQACVNGTLDKIEPVWSNKTAVCVVAASGGYPGAYEKGRPISGLAAAEAMKDIVVFHAGTVQQDGAVVTNGGRVLGVTAIGDTLDEARQKAYEAMQLIKFDGMHYRSDIGLVK